MVGVAAAAAVQSFSHIYYLARTHGQSELNSALLAISIDGTILAMSLLLLHEARFGRRAPGLVYLMLWSGIAVTVAANVIYGLPHGPVGAVGSAWPALGFIGSVHAVMLVVRTWRSRADAGPDKTTSAMVPGSNEAAARLAFRASAEATNPLSERQLVARFGVSRPQAKKIVAELATTSAAVAAAPPADEGHRRVPVATAVLNGQVHGG